MSHRLAAATVAMLALLRGGAAAQSYRPTHENPNGVEIVAVYLTAWSCTPCRGAAMPTLLDSIKVQLQRQAKARGQAFRAVFVGMDWQPEYSLALARIDGPWDELDIGRAWFNAGAELYAWGDTTTTPAMPQMIVYEQSVTMDARVKLGPRRALRRVLGPDSLAAWVAQASPIPK